MGMGMPSVIRCRTCYETSVAAEVRAIEHALEMRFDRGFFALPAIGATGQVPPRYRRKLTRLKSLRTNVYQGTNSIPRR